MKTTKVKRDSHGLYVRADGNVFRPLLARYSQSLFHNSKANSQEKGTSGFLESESVAARHLSGTTYGKVRNPDSQYFELWHSHGCYFRDGKMISSEECWEPSPMCGYPWKKKP